MNPSSSAFLAHASRESRQSSISLGFAQNSRKLVGQLAEFRMFRNELRVDLEDARSLAFEMIELAARLGAGEGRMIREFHLVDQPLAFLTHDRVDVEFGQVGMGRSA